MKRFRTIVVDPPWAYRETRASDATTPASPVCGTCMGGKFRGRRKHVCVCPTPNCGGGVKRYRTIVADPPWSYGGVRYGFKGNGRAIDEDMRDRGFSMLVLAPSATWVGTHGATNP